MERVAALLAAVVATIGLAACGDDGAEPGASQEATLVLDFQPNAVHAGIYTALGQGLLADEGVSLDVREPSSSTDAPKLLEAGRAQFAILDINDLAIARERGLELELVSPIVDRPLAAVIAERDAVSSPRELEGETVGVTGLPSDDAVLDSVVAADGGDPEGVERVTIGFDSVAALSAGRVAAATAFWNAEGVALRDAGVETREFRVDDFGAPRYPELVLATTRRQLEDDAALVASVRSALAAGYGAVAADPPAGVDALVDANPDLDASAMAAQMDALTEAGAIPRDDEIDPAILRAYSRWAAGHGIVGLPPRLEQAPASG
jgi:NitT/TauT family transport system substrate-binding protein/putative hydroxymethylpyrimidine transport system substrate-binding protein